LNGGQALKPLRVLLGRGFGDDAFFLLRELRRGGYEPEYLRVDTLTAATDALLNRQWDLLISDYNLPASTPSTCSSWCASSTSTYPS